MMRPDKVVSRKRSIRCCGSLVVVGNPKYWISMKIQKDSESRSKRDTVDTLTTIHCKNVKKRDQFSTKVKCQFKKKSGSDGGTSFM